MKNKILLGVLITSAAFGAAYDISISQRNSSNTGFNQILMPAPGNISGNFVYGNSTINVLNPRAFGARGDAIILGNSAITTGSAGLVCSNATFTALDVGKTILVQNAGVASADLLTTIAAFGNTTSVTLSSTASTTVTGNVVTGNTTIYGTDDTTALQATLNALPTTGGRVYINGGYLFSTLTASQPVYLFGDGMGSYYDSKLITRTTPFAESLLVSTTGAANAITLMANGNKFSDLAIVCGASTPTSGAGIVLAGTSVRGGNHDIFEAVMVNGFYDDIDVNAGVYYKFHACVLANPIQHGISIKDNQNSDEGDMSFSQCDFLANTRGATGAAIYWESGGGLRVENCKVNAYTVGGFRWLHGINLNASDTAATSVFVIVGNSIENYTGSAVYAHQKGPSNTGNIGKIVITSNELLGQNSNHPICLQGNSTQTIGPVAVADNVIYGGQGGAYGTWMSYIKGGSVGVNTVYSNNCIYYGPGTESVTGLTQNLVTGAKEVCTMAYDPSSTINIGVPHVEGRYQYGMPAITSTVTYTQLLTFNVTAFNGFVLNVNVSGQITGTGAFSYHAQRLVTRAASGGGSTALLVGTDTTTGAAAALVDIVFDTSSANSECRLNAKLKSGSGTMTGTITATVDGYCQIVTKNFATP